MANAKSGGKLLTEEALFGYFLALHRKNETGKEHPVLALLKSECVDGRAFGSMIASMMPEGSFEPVFEWINQDRNRFEKVEAAVRSKHEELKLSNMAPSVTFEEFLWGVCIMRTKSFQNAKVAWPEFGQTILIPLGDFFPHHHMRENVIYVLDPNDELWHFRAKQKVKKGDALFISFGCRSRIEYLAAYGFIPRDEANCEDGVIMHSLPLRLDGNMVKYGNFSKSDWHSFEAVRALGATVRRQIEAVSKAEQIRLPEDPVWIELDHLRKETIQFLKKVDLKLRAREFAIRPDDYNEKKRQRRLERKKKQSPDHDEL